MSNLLEVSNLEVAYGHSQVLFGLNLVMAEGEAATLLGRNGMGKTTTLRAICGLQAIKAGPCSGMFPIPSFFKRYTPWISSQTRKRIRNSGTRV